MQVLDISKFVKLIDVRVDQLLTILRMVRTLKVIVIVRSCGFE